MRVFLNSWLFEQVFKNSLTNNYQCGGKGVVLILTLKVNQIDEVNAPVFCMPLCLELNRTYWSRTQNVPAGDIVLVVSGEIGFPIWYVIKKIR